MKLLQIIRNSNKVLGFNQRHAYTDRAKNRSEFDIVNDKIQTKLFLEQNGITAFPKLIKHIDSLNKLNFVNWNTLPKSFVIKPAKGAEGKGIKVLYNKNKKGEWIDSSGSKFKATDLKQHCKDILQGAFGVHSFFDTVIFEERVRSHPIFKNYSFKGTPDIRILLYKNIPIQAIIRFPTKESTGKANLDLGAVGTGIDLATGITTFSIKGKKDYIEFVPGTKLRYQGLKIPYWNKILSTSIQIQQNLKLNIAAIDFLIDPDKGPLVVEINAQPGFTSQLINKSGLKSAIEKVKDIKTKNLAHTLRLSKDLFGGQVEEQLERISGKEIISSIIPVTLYHDTKKTQSLAIVDTGQRTTTIDSQIARKLNIIDAPMNESEYYIENIQIKIGNQLVDSTCKIVKKEKDGYRVRIGRKDLANFIVDIKKVIGHKEQSVRQELIIGMPKTTIKKMDSTLLDINTELANLILPKPLNLKEEKEKFFSSNFEYNPQFTYKPLTFNPDSIINTLNSLNPPDSEIGEIYLKKIKITKKIIFFLESIGKSTEMFTKRSIDLYNDINPYHHEKSLQIVNKHNETLKKKNKTKFLNAEEIENEIKKVMKEYSINYATNIVNSNYKGNSISINHKSKTINIPQSISKSESFTRGTIAHEIETHIIRKINGENQKYKIFAKGTANYSKWEEGLATIMKYIYSKTKYLTSPAIMYISTDYAKDNSFVQTFHKLNELFDNPYRNWVRTYRVKRGISDTSQPGAFMKDIIYLSYADKVGNYILQNPSTLDTIFDGKATPEELEKFTSLKSRIQPKLDINSVREILEVNDLLIP